MSNHVPVLLQETIDNLDIRSNGIYVDATLGRGSHAAKVLERLSTGFLYCFDQDQEAIDESKGRLEKISNRFEIIHANFENLKSELRQRNVKYISGAMFDLGVSSPQFDEANRGFSYRFDAKLDMRMNQENSLTAYEVVNEYPLEDLTRIFKEYGEEKFSYQIASRICRERAIKKIETTFQLVEIIKCSLPKKALEKKGHPAKQVFQAVRIEVNHELDALKNGLTSAIEMLESKGRICVITFNSLEDRIVKQLFRKYTYEGEGSRTSPIERTEADYKLVNRKVIVPSLQEMNENPRSKSAKLRVLERK